MRWQRFKNGALIAWEWRLQCSYQPLAQPNLTQSSLLVALEQNSQHIFSRAFKISSASVKAFYTGPFFYMPNRFKGKKRGQHLPAPAGTTLHWDTPERIRTAYIPAFAHLSSLVTAYIEIQSAVFLAGGCQCSNEVDVLFSQPSVIVLSVPSRRSW